MKELVSQPSAKPTRKWNYGAAISVALAAGMAGLQAYNPAIFNAWSPVIILVAGQLGFAIPAYVVKNYRT